MPPPSTRGAITGAILLAFLVSSCSDDAEPQSDPGISTSAEPSGSPSPTPDETPSQDAPGGNGLEFENLPSTGGPDGDVVQAYIDYYELSWRAITTNMIPAGIRNVAAPPAIDDIREKVSAQKKGRYHMSGEITVSFEVRDKSERFTKLRGCIDESGLTKFTKGKGEQPVDGVETDPTQLIDVTMQQSDAGWIVVDHAFKIARC